MNKEKLLELLETLRGIAEESNVASFERWHEDGWVNCKFRYRHEPQPPQSDPYEELKAAHAAGETIQINCGDSQVPDWADLPDPQFRCEINKYRIKPEPQKLPLSQDDVKAGDEFLAPNGNRYAWTQIALNVISLDTFVKTFESLMESGWKIRSIGETEWRPCYKLVEQ